MDSLKWLNQDTRILVVGDMMLDEYLEGQVNRISPEAPVPVHLVTKRTLRAGGAANTALNIARTHGHVSLASVVGNDEAGRSLLGLLENVDTSLVLKHDALETIKKTRITSGQQQIVRVDWEKPRVHTPSVYDELLEKIAAVSSWSAILISDYGKGLLDAYFVKRLISLAKSRNIPVAVDPKGTDYTKYQGATIVTPNKRECCEALGIAVDSNFDPAVAAPQLAKKFTIDNVLVTLGAQGMYLFESKPARGLHLRAEARDVFDVSGAGDTVAAITTLAMGSGLALADAVNLANKAAAVVVGKWGTHAITLQELQAAIQGTGSASKIFSLSRFQKQSLLRKPIVFTNGCFDILHAGHVEYLERARSLGACLVVGVNDDESVKRLKGPSRPINPLEQRARVLAALACVDLVIPFSEDTPLQLITTLNPNILVKGADYKVEEIVGADYVLKSGGRVETIVLVEGVSTTAIIAKMK